MKQLDSHDPYHLLFLEETQEQIEGMEQALIKLEMGEDDVEIWHHLFRIAHSLKGSSATLEIAEMTQLAHHLEGVMTCLKDGNMPLTEGLMDLLLEAVDEFKKIHGYLSGRTESPPAVENFVLQLAEFMSAGYCPTWASTSPTLKQVSRPQQESFQDGHRYLLEDAKASGCQVHITFEDDADLKSVKSFMIIEALEALGAVSVIMPPDYETLEDDEFGSELQLWLGREVEEAQIKAALDDLSELKAIVIKRRRSDSKSEEPAQKGTSEKLKPPLKGFNSEEQASVRVSVHKINQLINLVGELIIDKESLNRICRELGRTYKSNPSVQRLQELQEHIHYLGSELQEIALSTRMLPLETIFNKFPRMMRDLSKKLDKPMEFVVNGKETGIDRGMIESLVDPLTHLLRNAADHGLDNREAREQLGKSEVGRITLSASHAESHVIITVEDDGGGIDPLKIKKRALEKGLISEAEGQHMSREDSLACIFKPGFTTTEQVSEVSGRGVGLDVVKANISKLNGIIDVWTEQGMGTRFTIKLPLTLAIIKAMLVKEDAFVFALPMGAVMEVLRLNAADAVASIHKTGSTEILVWREMQIPLIRLRDYFEIVQEHLQKKPTLTPVKDDRVYLAVVGHGEKKMALQLGSILGEQEVVIKSFGEFKGKNRLLGELKGISGVSILGDGSFAHVLDVAAISRVEK